MGPAYRLLGLEVVTIPTHRPCIREDRDDLVLADQGAKWRAVEEEVVRVHSSGRPVLVGTGSVAESERLAVALGRRGVYCRVLEDPRAATELAEQRPVELARLISDLGRERARWVAQQLVLRAVDRCWSEHLAEMRGLRDEIHLVQLDGRDPVTEFCRSAVRSFDELPDRVAATAVAAFDRLRFGPGGVDWEGVGLERPSSTWTYLVNDQVWGDNLLRTLANHATWGLGVVALGPLLFAWGLYLRWRRRRAAPRG